MHQRNMHKFSTLISDLIELQSYIQPCVAGILIRIIRVYITRKLSFGLLKGNLKGYLSTFITCGIIKQKLNCETVQEYRLVNELVRMSEFNISFYSGEDVFGILKTRAPDCQRSNSHQ